MSRIAILSDIHFGKHSRTLSFTVPGEETQDKSKETYSLEEELIDLLKRMGPQYFFVAGDLTSIGQPQEFYYCEEKIISIAQQVGVEEKNIICVLGNHDIDWSISELGDKNITKDTNNQVGDIIKQKYQLIAANCAKYSMDRLVLKYDDEGPAPYSGIVKRDEFIVFILNSGWYCTHDQQFSHGKLESSQLEWLKKVVSEFKEDNRIKIILMHHHPFNYSYPIPSVDISTIEEGAELIEIAASNGIDIIVHGHRHHPRVETIKIGSDSKPITMICAGSLSVNSHYRNNGEIPNTIHFLDVDRDKEYQIVRNFKFTEASGWEPIDKYCKETPIDSVMKVGKVFSPDHIKAAIEKYIDCDKQQLDWEDLEECLQFMSYKKLNDKFIEILAPTHEVFGAFPQKVVLFKK